MHILLRSTFLYPYVRGKALGILDMTLCWKNYLYLGVLGMWGWGAYVGVSFCNQIVL
jgi:hypothetical protein